MKKALSLMLAIGLMCSVASAQDEKNCKKKARDFIKLLNNKNFVIHPDAYLAEDKEYSYDDIADKVNKATDHFKKNQITRYAADAQLSKNADRTKGESEFQRNSAAANAHRRQLLEAKKKVDLEGAECPRLLYNDSGILQSVDLSDKDAAIARRTAQGMLVSPSPEDGSADRPAINRGKSSGVPGKN